MTELHARWWIEDEDEGISTRYVITGQLVLETPAHFGNGEVDVLTDMPIMRDTLTNQSLLTGAAIAGALRSYLRGYQVGYPDADVSQSKQLWANLLFGYEGEGKIGYGSLLTIDDALGVPPKSQDSQKPLRETELRDGVAIDPKTRTAKKGALYNFEVLAANTTFDLRFELAIPCGHDGGRFQGKGSPQAALLQSLAIALQGLADGHIRLGKRKQRGFGQCKVENWQVKKYDLSQPHDLLVWLNRPVKGLGETTLKNKAIQELLGLAHLPADPRAIFCLEAIFSLDKSSLLIRSGGDNPNDPDMVQLRSNGKPIIPGTSWAGVLRGRAERIAQTLDLPKIDIFEKEKEKYQQVSKIIIDVFGGVIKVVEQNKAKPQPIASRLMVSETEITLGLDLVQNRVKIDRFTGGSYPTALFNQMPIWGKPETLVKLKLTLIDPEKAEIGLLLQVLKDLWTSDLPIGGESSVGRGRLQGRTAMLTVKGKSDKVAAGEWTISQHETGLKFAGDPISRLDEEFAQALVEIRSLT